MAFNALPHFKSALFVFLNISLMCSTANKTVNGNLKTNAGLQQNERLIKGTVFSAADNLPLAGATILIQGTRKGTTTNFEGEFTYLIKSDDIENIVLEISYLGMETITQLVGNKSEFVFYLQESSDQLDEVIITSSYGTKKIKEEVVGSIATLSSKDIAVEQSSESIDKMVDGQIAGVLIENTSGVGGPVKINIRGQGSLSPLGNAVLGTSTQPLIIVDGVIIAEEAGIDSSFFDGSGSFSEDLANPLAQIDPANIESFTVLKDAAAVSIYGADGANGVILITTKRGRIGKPKFNFATQLGVSEAINQIQYLNGPQYNELRNEFLINDGGTPVPYNGVDTDWFDLLNGAGIFNKYSFNVSGASTKFSYRASFSHLNIDEPQKGNSTKQYNLGLNFGYNLDKFKASLSLTPSYIQKDAPNIFYSYAFVPTASPYNDDGTFSLLGVIGLGNPLAAIAQNKNITNSYGLFGSINLTYDLTDNIYFSTLFGLDFKDKEQDRYFSGENESGRSNRTFRLNGIPYDRWGRRVINNRNSTKWNWQGQAHYQNKNNEIHSVDGTIGFELSKEKANFDYASGAGFVNPNIINEVEDAIQDDDPNTGSDDTRDNQIYRDDINENSRVSFFSQVNYNYKKRYFVLGNLRRDESSVFGDDTNVAINGGLGISWILTNEDFLKNSNWIDFLKLKASYGTTGNSRIGSYRSKGLYNISQNGYNNFDDANASDAPNGSLSWEKNTKLNIGVDFNFLNMVSLTLEYYRDNISDLITGRDIPTETGYSSIQLNAASMYNTGLEFSAKVDWFKTEKFSWTTSFNIATLNSKVTDLVGLGTDFSTSERALAQRVGFSTSTIWGIKWAGVDPATGRDLVDVNGNIYDAVAYNDLFTNADWEPLGDRQADAFGGFNNTFTINRDLRLAIRGSFQIGGKRLIQDELISNYNVTFNRNLSVNAFDFWRGQGDVALQPLVAVNPLLNNLSKFIYDETNLRISNINLSYNVPTDKVSFLKTLSVNVDVTNVLYWYKDKSPKGRNGIREFRFTYPQARTISCGINAQF